MPSPLVSPCLQRPPADRRTRLEDATGNLALASAEGPCLTLAAFQRTRAKVPRRWGGDGPPRQNGIPPVHNHRDIHSLHRPFEFLIIGNLLQSLNSDFPRSSGKRRKFITTPQSLTTQSLTTQSLPPSHYHPVSSSSRWLVPLGLVHFAFPSSYNSHDSTVHSRHPSPDSNGGPLSFFFPPSTSGVCPLPHLRFHGRRHPSFVSATFGTVGPLARRTPMWMRNSERRPSPVTPPSWPVLAPVLRP